MRSISLLLLVSAVLGVAPEAASSLKVSTDGRHLVDAQGRPFLMTGDSAWSIFVEPTLEEAELYLQDRADHGFNLVVGNLIEHLFASDPPRSIEGYPPFTGAPFATPNEAYFVRADSILSLAAERDLVVLMSVLYIGFECGSEGWCTEIEAASLSDMREWGRFLGNRYQAYDNIIWMVGGDADPTPIAQKVREVVLGIREFDTESLITAHHHRGTQAVTYWPGETWIQLNNVFAFRQGLYEYTQATYAHEPPLPFFLVEGFYENEHGATMQQIRAQAYWTILTGGIGTIFGNCPLWHFGYSWAWCALIDWEAQLSAPGSDQMTHYRALFESRRWAELVPDLDQSVLIGGAGTPGAEDHVLAAAAADGSSIIAYLPTARALTFDTAILGGGTVRAWWYDPSQGSSSLIGDFPSGVVNVAAPPPGDWVLVIDDASIGFAAPGTPLVTTAPDPRADSVRLDQNLPNPFNPATEIVFHLQRPALVRITVFDAAGRVVRSLLDEPREPGAHRIRWDGRDERGRSLASGVYYYRLEGAGPPVTRKMALVR